MNDCRVFFNEFGVNLSVICRQLLLEHCPVLAMLFRRNSLAYRRFN